MVELDAVFLQQIRRDMLMVQASIGAEGLANVMQHFPTKHNPANLANWVAYKVPISGAVFGHETMSSKYWCKVCWGHGTDHGGMQGILRSRRVERSTPEEGQETHGFFCKAVTYDYSDAHEQVLENTLKVPKSRQGQGAVSCGIIFTGLARWHKSWVKHTSPNTWDEQSAVASAGLVHSSSGRWCIREDIAELMFLWLACQTAAPPVGPMLVPRSASRQ